MRAPPPKFQRLHTALDSQTPATIRAVAVEALRSWWRNEGEPQQRHDFSLHGTWGSEFCLCLAKRWGEHIGTENKEAFYECQEMDFLESAMDAICWMIRAGIVRPRSYNDRGFSMLGLTSAGVRFLAAAPVHPLAPEFLERLKTRHPTLPDPALLLVEDVRACLDNHLLRPAVVLLGLAFETIIEAVLDDLEAKAIPVVKGFRKCDAGERIGRLKKAINDLDYQSDARRMTEAAIDYADHLRVRRNDAAHTTPRFPLEDLDEVEELLVSACRHLPTIWEITVTKTRRVAP